MAMGLKICDAFEAYKAIRATSDVEFDDFIGLIREFVSEQSFFLKKCEGCRAWTACEGMRLHCPHCQRRNSRRKRRSKTV